MPTDKSVAVDPDTARGKPALRVGIVTPYYKESPGVLKACHDSVVAQTYACTHYMVADGHPQPHVDGWNVVHIPLANSHGDNGNHARWVGALAALADGCNAIAFLDADNWFAPEHIAGMIELHAATGAAICTSGRAIHHLDGSFLITCKENDGETFVDTSCFFFTAAAFSLLSLWGTMPKTFSPINDRVLWAAARVRGISTAHDGRATVMFRSKYSFHYKWAGVAVPEGTGKPADAEPAFQAWKTLNEDRKRFIYSGHTDAAGRFYNFDDEIAVRFARANDLLAQGRVVEAAEIYLGVLKAAPLHHEALRDLAGAWRTRARMQAAERILSLVNG